MIYLVHNGNFSKTEKFLEKCKSLFNLSIFDKYGKMGVDALRSATPKRTGTTADSWFYEIEKSNNSIAIVWKNRNINKTVNIAVLIQYGHGTGTGGYVRGIDYINPAMKSVFQKIADDLWKEVTS